MQPSQHAHHTQSHRDPTTLGGSLAKCPTCRCQAYPTHSCHSTDAKPTHTHPTTVMSWEWHLPSTACTAVQSSLGSLKASRPRAPRPNHHPVHPSPMGARQNGSAASAWAFPSAQGGRSGDGGDKWPPALSPPPCSSCLMQSFFSPARIAGRGCLTTGTLIRSGEVCFALRGLRGWRSVQAMLLWMCVTLSP